MFLPRYNESKGQAWKTLSLNDKVFIPSSIATFVNPVQTEYLQPVITQYFASNKSEIWP